MSTPTSFTLAPIAQSRSLKNQQGVALVVVLLFLLAITGLTVWAARQSMLGEGMARNQLDQEVARQAAEAALRDAERDLSQFASPSGASCSRGLTENKVTPSNFAPDCTGGWCRRDNNTYARSSNWTTGTSTSADGVEVWWPVGRGGAWNNDFETKIAAVSGGNCSFTGAIPFGAFTGVTPIRGVALQPEYIVEYIGTRYSPILKRNSMTYRITARGFGYTQRTQVVLQSYFAPLFE